MAKFTTTGGPTFTFGGAYGPASDWANIDGLGRLKNADETLTDTADLQVTHSSTCSYDMLSELTDADITNIDSGTWVADYTYYNNGDVSSRMIDTSSESFTYNGEIMTHVDSTLLSWDDNGNMIASVISTPLEYNWDNKLRNGQSGTDTVDFVYDPDGNRISKSSSVTGLSKFIVDIAGNLPTILVELDGSNTVKKMYIYANSQIIAQHNGDSAANRYFYLHDRLGSVRQVIDPTDASVERLYTYSPFGEILEEEGTLTNNFTFAGQWLDSEISLYYMRARYYDPYLGRFTGRDLADGDYKEPMSLHQYLYCENDPINCWDPTGLWKSGLTEHNDDDPLWHGHSDFGYQIDYFNYTALDDPGITHPYFWPFGTQFHFMSLERAQMYVYFAIMAHDPFVFGLAGHMGQDYFSHRGRGYSTVGTFGHASAGDEPDNPYIDGDPKKGLSYEYRQADRWTKQMEEIWYLIWDTDKWWSLP